MLTITRSKPVGKQYGKRFGYLSLVSLALVGLFASANAYATTFVDLSAILSNSSFEGGNQAPDPVYGCPNLWTCNTVGHFPGATSYAPTSAEYVPGSDGLASGSVPDGSNVAIMPIIEGASTMTQMTTDPTDLWNSNDTYVLDLWIGTPLIDPLDGQNASSISNAYLYFFGTGGTLLGGGGDSPHNTVTLTPAPAAGMWEEDIIDFTPTSAENGQQIGVQFSVDTTINGSNSGNDDVVNFDTSPCGTTCGTITPPPTIPEPGTFLLIGMGMVSLAYSFRRKSVRNS